MILLCPHCGFRREVATAAPPSTGKLRVVCSACGAEFEVPPPAGDFVFETEPIADATPVKAGFWVRLIAALIDSALLTLGQIVLGTLLVAALSSLADGFDSDSLSTLALVWLFGSVLGLAYYVGFTAHGGQTPGKMALRLKVIRTDGGEIGLGKAFYREALGKFVSGVLLGIGYLMVAFDPQKQGLHDRMAATYVIKL